MYCIDCLECCNSFTISCKDKDYDELYCVENNRKVDECEFCNKFNK